MILGINGIIATSRGVSDSDAQAFITAASITDSTQQSAINQLVLDLKSANIWTKMKALYPFVGGTANSHKFNLKDPRDLDAAYRLVFNGGWTHSSTGALPNGTNGYANTKLNLSTSGLISSDIFQSVYVRSNNISGITSGASSTSYFMLAGIGGTPYVLRTWMSVSGPNYLDVNVSTIKGLISGSCLSTTSYSLYQNGSKIGTKTGVTILPLPNREYYIGARNDTAGATSFDNKEIAFSVLSNGLNDTEISLFYSAVQTFQTTLNRQV